VRSYKPGDYSRAEEVKIAILNLFKSNDDRLSVGQIYEEISSKYQIKDGIFFEYLGYLENKKYLAHEVVKEGNWSVSVMRRL
jgi:hypothetical protein